MSTEEWRAIPGHEGRYEVSDKGRVRSFARGEAHILATWTSSPQGHLKTRIGGRAVSGRYIHQLVLEAFVGPRPEGMVTRHLNGDPADNRVENLAWGTQSENNYDAVRHGTHAEASRTHCLRGHEFTAENTRHYNGARFCRTCARERMRRVRAKRYAAAATSLERAA